ncbi:hypothetical protein ACFYUY_35010 [Kitasatospora sp. NPDC004745]|uniref:hypothetical protein n=1 Tax=Kitasatospora sp. NPDC004745 TaxID=3364019 RepID=UPI0036A735BA
MTISTAIPTAQPRKRRTRTTNVSCKPALLLSELPRNLVDLTPRAEHLACPGCGTWCPLTAHKGTKEWKLVPHHTTKAGSSGARRCGNSNRLFVIDISLSRWQEQRVEASADVAARRSTKVLKKVKTPVTPALHQLEPAAPTADTAHAAYVGHRSRCTACTDPRKRCSDGLRLGATYLELLRQEPERRAAQAQQETSRRASERAMARELPARRAAEWAGVRLAVLAADVQREVPLEDAVGPIRGAQVPTETLHPAV